MASPPRGAWGGGGVGGLYGEHHCGVQLNEHKIRIYKCIHDMETSPNCRSVLGLDDSSYSKEIIGSDPCGDKL